MDEWDGSAELPLPKYFAVTDMMITNKTFHHNIHTPHTECKRKRCCIKIRRLPYLLFSMTDELANMYRIHAGVFFTNISGTLCIVKIWLFTFIPKYYLSCCANPLTSFNQYANATGLSKFTFMRKYILPHERNTVDIAMNFWAINCTLFSLSHYHIISCVIQYK